MLDRANRIPLSPPPADEISTGEMLRQLAASPQLKLIFSYEGQDVLPGYHVTEVKDGQFEGLDCGTNPEAWRETFIQLWDVPADDGRTHMPVKKFTAILGKVGEVVPFDPNAKLTFEVSDGVGAIKLYRAEAITLDGDAVRVALSRRPASCKPRDRWLEAQQVETCCGSDSKASCCG
ncbi:DUF6428 family protein [Bradyrhizobium sp. LHD-71]|uniref:DUF6428 family protein n=1 Tax=Bradyrhizobium sp. LHD-71 TaxID=3072141 RepID=UPI00281022BE|nr:DUF6428 family protein [Bradyrhizobium sp. LHD-71]MDQ8730781.1 DUF6428 family protein [Bradyrhizobium sp. LHD-71]